MATAGMSNDFTCIGIFLGCESERGKCGKLELCNVSSGSGEGLVAYLELHILEPERLVGCASSRMGVLTWSEEEEETNGS